jgi:hypothetical protein
MLPLEAVNAYGVFQYVVQPSSLDLSLEPPSASLREREREKKKKNYLDTVRSIR